METTKRKIQQSWKSAIYEGLVNFSIINCMGALIARLVPVLFIFALLYGIMLFVWSIINCPWVALPSFFVIIIAAELIRDYIRYYLEKKSKK